NDAQLPMTNKMLSVKRVYALKQQLIDAGVGFVRVDAEGLGNGVMEKDTARRANRVPMREILVKFIKK
ncbi:MAG: cell envelope biogenesis protein OmpA, partial [Runella slithyformis]